MKRIHVIINPAAGQDEPVLSTLNNVFRANGYRWDISITRHPGDACQQAKQAVDDGVDVVAAYGGDGTVAEAAAGLAGSEVPLAILPGGTANVLSREFTIPQDLKSAAALITPEAPIKQVDMGHLGDRLFMVRVSVGMLADMIRSADRKLKNQFGTLAYVFKGLEVIQTLRESVYHIVLDDDREFEMEGVTCMIANSGSDGAVGLRISPKISVTDGLLDVIVLRRLDLPEIFRVLASAGGMQLKEPLPHWQAHRVRITVDPPQSVTLDGEPEAKHPLEAEILPGAVKVLVPPPTRGLNITPGRDPK